MNSSKALQGGDPIRLSDVLLDFGGVVCGTALCCAGIALWDKRKRQRYKIE